MKTLLAFTVVVIVAPFVVARRHTPDDFRFIHITDTHLTASGNIQPLKELVATVNSMDPKPAFVVDTGDVTEAGRQEEYDHFMEAASGFSMPFYCAPGNHDVRWAPLGKEAFSNVFKSLYRSFDHNGCHFVVLDSTVLLEHWGHFDAAELKWLESDLKKLKSNIPVFLFFHHWVGRDRQMVDNQDELLSIIAPYNVVAMFIGHGHSDIAWKVNGIDCFMARGLYQGSYNLVDVGASEVKVFRVRKEDTGKPPTLVATLPRDSTTRRKVAFAWDDANISLLTRRTFVVEFRDGKKTLRDQGMSAKYSIDGGPAEMMVPDVRIEPREKKEKEGRFVARFETKSLGSGWHRVLVRVTAPDGEVFQREESFAVERLEGHPKGIWELETGDTIQGSATVADGVVIVGSFDGKVYAVDAAAGKRKWTAPTKAAVFSTPVVSNGIVYIGSTDHFLFALEAGSGHVKWKFDAGTPIFASAAVSAGTVCFGANKRIFGVEEATGKQRWVQDAGGLFQSRAATADGAFYLGGWDNTLYALEADTGTIRWKSSVGRANKGTGALSFYYSPAIASPAVGDGRVYVCTNDGTLHAVNVKTGADDWTAHAPAGGDGLGYSSPVYDDGKVYVGGLGEKGNGDCYAFNAKTGDLVWRCSTGADNYDSSPIRAGAFIAIGSVDGRISWIDPGTGKVKYQYGMPPGFCFSTPSALGKTLFIPSMNGRLEAISTP